MFGSLNNEIAKKQFKNRNKKNTKNTVYPWNNYDFDYQQYIKNNYSPEKLGFSDKPYLSTLTKDILAIPEYPSILAQKPLLSKNTIAGKSDIDDKNKDILTIKNKYSQFKEPYPGFKKEYPEYFPLTGEKANNYFIKIGTCPVKKIKNKKECEAKGYNWHSDEYASNSRIGEFYNEKDNPPTNGYCFKPRYMYVNNNDENSTSSFNGIINNLGKNIKDLNPMPLLQILMGGEPDNKDMLPLKCIENFTNPDINYFKLKISLIIFMVIMLFIILFN